MGDLAWLALYAGFGVVALWLLWEVLMQYKAPLRWRALAFVGFLCVVLGVLMPAVPVIGLGVVVFGVGQAKVTLSYRSGYSEGWAVNRRDEHGDEYDAQRYGAEHDEAAAYGERRAPLPERGPAYPAYEPEGAPPVPPAQEQTAQFSPFGEEQVFAGAAPAQQQAYAGGYDSYGGAGYDTGGYATTSAYDTGGYATTSAYDTGSHVTTSAYDTGSHATTSGYEAGGYATNGAGTNGYGQDQQIYPDSGGYGTEHQYAGYDTAAAGYTDPYGGTEYAAPAPPPYYDSTQGGGQSYDTSGAGYPGYDQQQYAQYAEGYDTGQQPAYGQEFYGTPAEGVWMPQQRDADPLGTEDPYAQQQGYPGYEQQYRY
ncbi:hypothetical protein O7599_30760 [Streptomyces sp. WMMC500]|uniref:hypothetical protein n=1 Tax=Streptomyces sp. WMMC500 TaxID=3015154 RepID=UPI00248C91EC|nr:hypothetical protein [Streptomyces sp. WMMC500]WBB59885.1 hypothetical protein O7599_30760 [Streptomyces sp. WMMC500]